MAHIDSVFLTSYGLSDISFSDKAIIDSISLHGYWADIKGRIYNADGKLMRGSPKKSGHLSVTLTVKHLANRCIPVLYHRFVAYYFFGLSALKCQCIRHLDGNPMNNSVLNLIPGTKRENRADIPKQVLSAIAKRNAYLLVARSRKLSNNDVINMRLLKQSTNTSYSKIAKQFKVSNMTAYRAVVGTSWSNLV